MLSLRTTSTGPKGGQKTSFSFIYSRNIVSVKPPRIYPTKSVPRVYSERKTFLYNQYLRLLETSSSCPLVFLQHNNFQASRLIKLRRDIALASERSERISPSLATPSPSPTPISQHAPSKPTFTVVRSSLLGVALRDYAPLDIAEAEKLSDMVDGGLAILSLPTLNPPQLNAVLRAFERSVPPVRPETEEGKRKKEAEKNADPVTPGRRVKKQRPDLPPKLSLVGALIDGRIFTPEAVKEVSKLPTLETLRAQIIGLLSSPAAQLVAVLNEAGGTQLARTLEGLKLSLQEGVDEPSPPSSQP